MTISRNSLQHSAVKRDVAMTASVSARAFLAGAWAANGLPHLIHGSLQRSYPCRLGDGPATNVLAGVIALSLVPFVMGPDRAMNRETRWLMAAAGAFMSLKLHIRYGKVLRPRTY